MYRAIIKSILQREIKTQPIIIFFVLFTLISCNQNKKKESLFTSLDSSETGIDFTNKVIDTKDFNIFSYRNFYNGAGVGIGDINNDGLPDVYLVSNQGKNKLYLNQGQLKFKDITKTSGVKGTHSWSTGVVMVDVNNDGYLDIYVSNAGNKKGDSRQNELFINNGDLTFIEQASKYGLDDSGFTTQTSFFDYDGDGDLDAYILNNSFIPVNSLNYTNKRNLRDKDWPLPDYFKGGGDKLLRNNNGKFEDVSAQAGIYGSLMAFGLGLIIGDVNNDMLPDIYVCNDFYERDYLYINQGDGTFKEKIKDYMTHITMSSMGADMADINNDGYQDIYVADMLQEDDKRLKELADFESYYVYKLKKNRDFYNQYMQNSLQLNNANNSFSEIGFYSNTAQTDWSWATLLFDMDNDGYKDIFVTNGLYRDLTNQDFMNYFANSLIQKMALTGKREEIETIINKMPSTPILNYAFKNNKNFTFTNKAKNWGFDKATFSNGAAYADLDNDGDLDLVVNNVNQKALLYQNNTSQKLKHRYLSVKLKGSPKNKFAIGAKVTLYKGKQIFTQEEMPSRGFQSSVDYNLVFGLDSIKIIDSLEVIWPDKKIQILKNIKTNQSVLLDITQADISYDKSPLLKKQKTYFSVLYQKFKSHKEDDYNDFQFEGLVPKMLSKEGPALAVGDVNNDGLDDVYIGGAYNQKGQLYLQNTLGKFTAAKFATEAFFEDTCAKFIDIDNDGDLDLVVGSGGNFKKARTGVRAYINDGNAHFGKYKIIARIKANIASLAPNDFDNDGDIDLFVGAISIPNKYGINPPNLLLQNDGNGNFYNVTKARAPQLKNIGMVSDAVWQDMNGDNIKDLIVVGDWMAPKIFINNTHNLTELKTNLSQFSGAYNSVKAVDIDNDGDMDLLLGNRGNNSFLKADSQHPAKLFVNDFDNNGSVEQITTRTIKGKDVPVHLLKEISMQITSIKNAKYSFSDYAAKSINDLFTPEILNKSLVKSITNFKSVVLLNNDNSFTIKELPARAQFSTINNILVYDINKDGNLDLITTGNKFNYKTQYTRQDASYGDVYFGDGHGGFSWQPPQKTGFFVKGQINAMQFVKQKNKLKYILVTPNNDVPKLFEYNE
jgi:enediyne biosynthesis protein E4